MLAVSRRMGREDPRGQGWVRGLCLVQLLTRNSDDDEKHHVTAGCVGAEVGWGVPNRATGLSMPEVSARQWQM